MKSVYTACISDEVKKAIRKFDKLDLNDPNVIIGLNSVAHTALYLAEQWYPGLESDLLFNYDPDPFLQISWIERITGMQDEIIFRFKPLRIEGDMRDVINAHNRAMSII